MKSPSFNRDNVNRSVAPKVVPHPEAMAVARRIQSLGEGRSGHNQGSDSMRRQKGYVIVLVVLIFGVVFTMGAAGMDIAALYRWRVRLNRATDAAIQAGLDQRLQVGWQRLYADPKRTTSPTFEGERIASPPPSVSPAYQELRRRVAAALRDNLKVSLATQYEHAETLVDDEEELKVRDTDIVWDPITDVISVTAQYRAPSSFFGNLGRLGLSADSMRCGADGRCALTVTRRASLARAAVAIVVDASGSMVCPVDGGCSCRLTNTCGVTPNGFRGRKIDFMIDAILEFSRYFNPNRDSIGVIAYRLSSTRLVGPTMLFNGAIVPRPFGSKVDKPETEQGVPIASQSGYSDFENQIKAITASSNTNQCDGIVEGVQMLTELRNAHMTLSVLSGLNYRPFLVLFGDGSPTAFRGQFTGMVSDGQYDGIAQGSPVPSEQNDVIQYEVQYGTDPAKPLQAGFYAPSMLVSKRGANLTQMYNFNFLSEVGTNGKRVPLVVPSANLPRDTCGDVWPDPGKVDLALDATRKPIPAGKRPGCLRGLEFKLPFADHSPVAADVATDGGTSGPTFFNYFPPQQPPLTNPPVFTGGTEVEVVQGQGGIMAVSKMRELYYYCSIEAADYAREKLGASVFTIGVGAPAPLCSDPLQDVLEDNYRKDIFLGRLAADPSAITITPKGKKGWFFDTKSGVDFNFSPRREITLSNPKQPAPESVGTDRKTPPRPACNDYHRTWRRFGDAGKTMMVGYSPSVGEPTPPPNAAQYGAYFAARDYSQISLMFVQAAKSILARLDSN